MGKCLYLLYTTIDTNVCCTSGHSQYIAGPPTIHCTASYNTLQGLPQNTTGPPIIHCRASHSILQGLSQYTADLPTIHCRGTNNTLQGLPQYTAGQITSSFSFSTAALRQDFLTSTQNVNSKSNNKDSMAVLRKTTRTGKKMP